MTLLDDLAEDGRFGSDVRKDLEVCRVPDIFGFDDPKVLFIAESPHTDEVRFGAPFSGRSGKDMTRVLLNRVFEGKEIPDPIAFGRCIQFQSAFFRHFGVMNVCNIPLQSAALKDAAPEMRKKYEPLFEAFKTLRSNPAAANRTSETVAWIERMILKDFAERLESRLKADLLVIPCGNVARGYFEKSGLDIGRENYLGAIPHPSYGQWLTSAKRDLIQQMCRRIRKRIDA